MINIWRGNHHSFKSDISDVLNLILKKSVISNKFDETKVNIVLDEFSTKDKIRTLENFKNKFPNAKVVFVGTEFIERINNYYTFNVTNKKTQYLFIKIYKLLEKKKYFKTFLCCLNNFYKIELIKICIISIIYLIKKHIVLKIAFFFKKFNYILFFKFLHNYFETFLNKTLSSSITYKSIYNHYRFEGFIKASKYFDYYLLVHKEQIKNYNNCLEKKFLGVFYPPLNLNEQLLKKIFRKKKTFFIMSGTLSNYRIKQLKIFAKIIKNKFNVKINKLINNDIKNNFSFFSFHPKQSKSWKYSSPFRIFRSIFVQLTIPVSPNDFKQHPIDRLVLKKNSYELKLIFEGKLDKFYKQYKKKIKKYNKYIFNLNKKINLHLNEIK